MVQVSPKLADEYTSDKEQWRITSEEDAQKALSALEQNQKPPEKIIVRSTAKKTKKPIEASLSPLLIKLAEAGRNIDLHLWDSFWRKETPPDDSYRLGEFIRAGHAGKLTHFFGHVDFATAMKMTSVEDFGLRLEKTTDVAELNSLEKCNSVAVSRNIKPEDITERLKSVHSITFAKLQDDEVAWAVAVAEKLLPETHQDRLPAHLRTGKALNQLILKRWFLTRSGLEELLNTSDPNIASIFLEVHEHHTITDEEKSKLCELAGQKGIELFWHMPKFHDNRGIKRRQ